VAEGKHVVAVDKDVDALAEIRSSSLVVRVCDLKDSYQIEELWRWLAGQAAVFGPVEVLVNNAGIGGARGLLDGTTAEWLAMVQVNLLAPTLCSKLAISNMTEHNKQPRGHIINVLSVWGCEVPRREYTHFYSATKHALKAVAEGLRIELATRKLPIKVAVFLLRWSIPQGYQCLPWTSRDKFQCQLLWRRRGGQSIWGSSRL